LRQQRKHAEAEPLLRECLAIRQQKEPDVWTTFETQALLGTRRGRRRSTTKPSSCCSLLVFLPEACQFCQ
jgi:hypothetical protein